LSIKHLPMNLAIIGCGGYAAYLRDRISELPEICRLVAIVTRNSDSEPVQQCAAAGVSIYKDIDALIANVPPETCPAIVIPTSIDSHFEYAAKAVENGFHVLLEKPPVVTIQDMDKLIELQRRTGKWIAVNFQHLFATSTAAIKNRLMFGEFGAIKSVHAHALWPRSEEYFRRAAWSGKLRMNNVWVLDGTIGNPLAHLMAEALYLGSSAAGMASPETVQAELYHANAIESEDTNAVCIQAENGVKLLFSASLATPESGAVVCEIRTEKATVTLTDFCTVDVEFHDGRRERQDFTEEDDGIFSRLAMLRSTIHSLKSGERPLITVEECRPFVLAWNGAFESAGIPAAIDAEFTAVKKQNGNTFRYIKNIGGSVRQMAENGTLFSAAAIPWAKPGRIVDMRNYTHFPSLNYELIELEQIESRRIHIERAS